MFDDGINEIPLKNVSMKIRMNSTYVHDTELLKEPLVINNLLIVIIIRY